MSKETILKEFTNQLKPKVFCGGNRCSGFHNIECDDSRHPDGRELVDIRKVIIVISKVIDQTREETIKEIMKEELINKIKKIIPEIEIEVFAGNKEMRSSMITVKTRPITLEDILRCLSGKEKCYCVNCYGEFSLCPSSLGFNWQLGKPLHEQSEETIKELNNLI